MKYQSFITLMLFHKPYQFSVILADLVAISLIKIPI